MGVGTCDVCIQVTNVRPVEDPGQVDGYRGFSGAALSAGDGDDERSVLHGRARSGFNLE